MPELKKITYNNTRIRPDAPFLFWKIGKFIQNSKRYIKRQIYRLSNGRLFFPDKQNYASYDDLFRINKDWIKFFKDLLLDKTSLSKKYFNQKYISYLFQQHKDGKFNYSPHLIYLATFEIFLRTFMNKNDQ